MSFQDYARLLSKTAHDPSDARSLVVTVTIRRSEPKASLDDVIAAAVRTLDPIPDWQHYSLMRAAA